jgi:dTDP-4-dehydrorhamnose 3,5-epimerase
VEIEQTGLPGCVVVRPRAVADARGNFVKTFHAGDFERLGLRCDWREEFYSSSVEGVVRGMHFQIPPADHAKLVYCVRGEVLDVVVDLRAGSPTYGEHRSFGLSEDNHAGLYIPSGLAHGFVSVSALSTMLYKVTSVHSPEHDAGIAWDSFGLAWPVTDPQMSDRDRRHPPLAAFETPFSFNADAPHR